MAAQGIKNGVCNYMNSDSYYDTHWQEFINYTVSLDKIRNESIKLVCPGLGKYIDF